MDRYEAVIGLEVHVHLATRTKMFCRCGNVFGDPPNTRTCPVCMGLPGALPSINRRAVDFALRAGLAFGCEVAPFTKFDRKNYYYPDLPKNYQISQYDLPIAKGGAVEIATEDGIRRVRLIRVHLEEDAGKNVHPPGGPDSWVDLNRAGVPLLEIVSLPDLRSPEDTVAYLKSLRLHLRHIGISDCNMEEGSMRCEPNISLRPRGSETLGTLTEIKNLNSFVHVGDALAYEIARQAEILDAGGRIVRQTLLWDPQGRRTQPMRSKELAHDYRYFPEPDLPPLRIDETWIGRVRAELPELPARRVERYRSALGLSFYDAETLSQDREIAEFFDAVAAAAAGDPGIAKKAASWIQTDVLRLMNEDRVSIARSRLRPEALLAIIRAVDGGAVNRLKARDVLDEVFRSGADPHAVIRDRGLAQVSDDASLRAIVQRVIAANPRAVEDFRKGKEKASAFLMGQAMRESRGKANPKVLLDLIREALA
ncbi:MAG: Asp-tRNA(Asn)/Glu-tRNA(Gln) amidotransferase subunit GatB [Planctomycetes bacterium]|nr:Asp-tRNA(Asn)/Glu-tRNA(Gln) amidotransferase subunit GatB [Planctomycetota bacterium]